MFKLAWVYSLLINTTTIRAMVQDSVDLVSRLVTACLLCEPISYSVGNALRLLRRREQR